MAGPLLLDRVRERTATEGTGTLALSGAVPGYQSFAAVGDGNSCYYAASDLAGNWEVGIGTYTAATASLSRAAEVGEVLGLNKEKRLVDLAIGVTNNYKWKGTAYNTYYDADDGGPWVNTLAGNELVDWTDVDAAEQLFADILDPNTGEPVLIQGTTVLVMPAYRHAAHRIFNAAEITYTAAGSPTATTAANPLGNYRVVESRLAYRRIVAAGQTSAAAKKWWFIGDFRKAFAYMENWPITVTQSPPGSEADFNQDIVVRFKASERGAAAVINPRFVVRSTGAGA